MSFWETDCGVPLKRMVRLLPPSKRSNQMRLIYLLPALIFCSCADNSLKKAVEQFTGRQIILSTNWLFIQKVFYTFGFMSRAKVNRNFERISKYYADNENFGMIIAERAHY